MIIDANKITVHLSEEDADVMQNALVHWKGPYRDGEKLTDEERARVVMLTDKAKRLGEALQDELIRRWKQG